MEQQSLPESLGLRGELTLTIRAEHPERIVYSAEEHEWVVKHDGQQVLVLRHRNAFVRSGLRNTGLRTFGLGGAAISAIGVDNNSTAVTFDTRFLHGAGAGTQPPTASANQVIKAFNPAAVAITDGAGVVQSITGGATFTNADFTPGGNVVFVINKVGLLTSTTDADGNLMDVIGGTSGSAPYNRTFVLDLTNSGNFSVVAQITVTYTAI